MQRYSDLFPGYVNPSYRGLGLRWLALIEGMDNGRLRRGRAYARAGNVTSLTFTEDGVEARVRGSYYTPYQVRLRIPPIPRPVWEAVLEAVAANSQLVAAILAGELPPELEQLLAAHRQRLFPTNLLDGEDECSCYDWSRPCKHIAAVYYVLADVLEKDPHALFTLRGLPKEQLIERLEEIRERLLAERFGPPDVMAGEDTGDNEADETAGNYWELGLPLDSIQIRAEPPAVHAIPLKALGAAPYGYDFRGFMTRAEQVYAAIARSGLRLLIEQAQAAGQDDITTPPPALEGPGRRPHAR